MMKKKLCILVRHLSPFSSCYFQKHKYYYYSCLTATTTATAPTLQQSHSQYLLNLPNPKPYFFIPTLPFSTTTVTTTRKPVSIYLKERLGFSEEQSLAVSKKLLNHRKDPRANQVNDLIKFEKADNVISFLNECGLDLSQIKQIVSKYPRILTADVDKTIKPKIKLLQHLGFSTSDLALVLSVNPRFYLEADLGPAIQALRGILGSDGYVVILLRRVTCLSATQLNYIIPNVDMLENEYGVPRDKLRKLLTRTPRVLMWRTDWLRDVLVRIEDKWGITRDSTEFLRAVEVFRGFSEENINSKCQVFRSFGWSEYDIKSLIRQHPTCIKYSVTNTRKSLEFYMNELGFEPAYLAARAIFFGYSLENRVLPRHKVLLILKEKGLIKADYQLYSAIRLTEDRFLNSFVIPYEGVVPYLREVLVNGRAPCEVTPHGRTSKIETGQ